MTLRYSTSFPKVFCIFWFTAPPRLLFSYSFSIRYFLTPRPLVHKISFLQLLSFPPIYTFAFTMHSKFPHPFPRIHHISYSCKGAASDKQLFSSSAQSITHVLDSCFHLSPAILRILPLTCCSNSRSCTASYCWWSSRG